METSNTRYMVTVLANGSYIIQDANPDLAYSDSGVWASLHNPGFGQSPTFFDPNNPEDMKKLKARLEWLIGRDEEYRESIRKTTPVSSISAKEFLEGSTMVPKARTYTKWELKAAFRYYAYSSTSQQPYNEKELNQSFENFCKVLDK